MCVSGASKSIAASARIATIAERARSITVGANANRRAAPRKYPRTAPWMWMSSMVRKRFT